MLFKIDPSDFGVWRPLLVTFVHDDGTVDGELFLNWERDRRAEWPATKLFWGLSEGRRTTEVRNVAQGEAVGSFKFHQPGPTFEELQARIDKLEKARVPQGPPRPLVPEKRTR